MLDNLELRDLVESDLAVLFTQQADPVANQMAAFTAKDPSDEAAFTAKWGRILGDEAIVKKVIVVDGRVVGNVVSFLAPWSGTLEVSYWIGREYWGKGIATRALAKFLTLVPTRPLYARAAADNHASIRVLEKCGFRLTGHEMGFANARGAEIQEVVMELAK